MVWDTQMSKTQCKGIKTITHRHGHKAGQPIQFVKDKKAVLIVMAWSWLRKRIDIYANYAQLNYLYQFEEADNQV